MTGCDYAFPVPTARRRLGRWWPLLLPMAVAACAAPGQVDSQPARELQGRWQDPPQAAASVPAEAAPEQAAMSDDLTLVIPFETVEDAQGSVQVAVRPLGRESAESGRLVFEVSMNTHSVDLSMDLAQLATLETDTGLSLPALRWSGGSGHHVTGWLEFELPVGEPGEQLARANLWRMTLRNVDAPERIFEWSRGPS